MYQEPYQMERMIQIFLHDLRSPLGVAQGYMHLLGGTQLPDEARPRAVQGVNDALNRMAKMVDDVSTLMERDASASHPGAVKASRLCDRIRAVAEKHGVQMTCPDAYPDVLVRVGPSLDQLSEAMMVLLHLADADNQRAADPISMIISLDDAGVRFSTCRASSQMADPRDLVPFDPWQTGKLDYLVAFRRLSFIQGGLWSKVGETRACGVTLPVEVVTE
jgi:hypothetical protein